MNNHKFDAEYNQLLSKCTDYAQRFSSNSLKPLFTICANNNDEFEIFIKDKSFDHSNPEDIPVYTSYFLPPEHDSLTREERLMITMANLLGFEPAQLLNLSIFSNDKEDI